MEENKETYYGDNERDPHEEVEPSKYVVEALLPILSFGWRYNILAKGLG